LAAVLVERRIDLVYGGAKVGLMGAVADAVRRGGGHVTGVIPRPLLRAEIGHEGLDEFHLVESMHERKALMASLADGFIMLPGGLGTLEEFFEVVTWNQLGLHEKPAGILNVGGYFDGVLDWMRHAVDERFVRAEHIEAILSENDPGRLLAAMEEWRMPKVEKWLDRK
jgi:hypothetical protein